MNILSLTILEVLYYLTFLFGAGVWFWLLKVFIRWIVIEIKWNVKQLKKRVRKNK